MMEASKQKLGAPVLAPTKEPKQMMNKNKMGVLIFIGSEVIFFGLLILSYIYFHSNTSGGPSASKNLDIVLTGIFTVFLLSSSLTIWLADRAMARGNRMGMVLWLIATILLGGVFLVGQLMEYAKLLNENISLSTNLFGTTFFTLTGFHGLHVFVGLIMLSMLAGYTFLGKVRIPHSVAADCVSYYWHFVDVVWIFVFTIVYLFR